MKKTLKWFSHIIRFPLNCITICFQLVANENSAMVNNEAVILLLNVETLSKHDTCVVGKHAGMVNFPSAC